MDPLKVLIVTSVSDVLEMIMQGLADIVIEEHLFLDLATRKPEGYVFEVYAADSHQSVIETLWNSGICYKQSNGTKRLRNVASFPWARTYAGYTTEDIVEFLSKAYELDLSRIGLPRVEGVKAGYFERPAENN